MPFLHARVLVPQEPAVAQIGPFVPHRRQLAGARGPSEHAPYRHLRRTVGHLLHGTTHRRTRLRGARLPQPRRGDPLGQNVAGLHGIPQCGHTRRAGLRIPLLRSPEILCPQTDARSGRAGLREAGEGRDAPPDMDHPERLQPLLLVVRGRGVELLFRHVRSPARQPAPHPRRSQGHSVRILLPQLCRELPAEIHLRRGAPHGRLRKHRHRRGRIRGPRTAQRLQRAGIRRGDRPRTARGRVAVDLRQLPAIRIHTGRSDPRGGRFQTRARSRRVQHPPPVGGSLRPAELPRLRKTAGPQPSPVGGPHPDPAGENSARSRIPTAVFPANSATT